MKNGMLQWLWEISVLGFGHGKHLTEIHRNEFTQWITIPRVYYSLVSELPCCRFWHWQPLVMDEPLAREWNLCTCWKRTLFNNGCFMDVFQYPPCSRNRLWVSKWNYNNISNALAALRDAWCLSSSRNGQPWTESGPLQLWIEAPRK